MEIATKRATAGLMNDAADVIMDHLHKTGSLVGWWDAIQAAFADRAIERFEPKIRNMFERAGVPLQEGTLNAAAMAKVVGDILGVQIEDLSVDTIKAAMEVKLSAALSSDLGINIQNALSDGIKQTIEDEVIKAIKDGRALGLLNRAKVAAARRYAAYKQEGYAEKEDQRKVMARLWQKRYRSRNRLVWD